MKRCAASQLLLPQPAHGVWLLLRMRGQAFSCACLPSFVCVRARVRVCVCVRGRMCFSASKCVCAQARRVRGGGLCPRDWPGCRHPVLGDTDGVSCALPNRVSSRSTSPLRLLLPHATADGACASSLTRAVCGGPACDVGVACDVGADVGRGRDRLGLPSHLANWLSPGCRSWNPPAALQGL